MVQRHPGHGRQILPVERDTRVEGSGEEVGERDDDCMSVSLLFLHIEKTFCPGTPGFIDRDNGPRRKLMLLGDAGDQPSHLVSAAAGASWNDKLNRLRGFPSLCSVPRRKNDWRQE